MKKIKFSKADAYLVIFVLILVLAGGLFVIGKFLLPSAVAHDFGAPQADLPWFKRMTLSVELILNREDLLAETQTDVNEVEIFVSSGESASTVAQNLMQENLIPNADAFVKYMIYKGFDTAIQQGKFLLETGATPVEIAEQLIRQEKGITIFAGYRLEEVAQVVAASTNISEEEFLELAYHPAQYGIVSTLPIENGLEGFLLPQTYPITDESISAHNLITAMLLQMESIVTPDMIAGFEEHGLTVKEAFTMASMIERENYVHISNEMEQMASVYYNRIQAGMMFQSDPTVQYGLRNITGEGEWWPMITQDDYTNTDSPYNTYLNAGFPPGPICMPSKDALRAVAYPVDTDYLYFRSCPGEEFHRFTVTHDEHLTICP